MSTIRPFVRLEITILGLALALAAAPALLAQDAPPPPATASLRLPKAAAPPRLDDYVGGVPADAGLRVTEFLQNTPDDGAPVTLPTTAYLSYDDKQLYVVFVCKDDPAQIRAHLGKREDIFGDEGVEIFLDTFHDRQRAYVFAINPFGVQLDGIYTEGQGYQFDFDTLWTSEGRLTDDGYVAMLAIPWKSMRFPKAPEQEWGFALARIIPRKNEFAYYPLNTQRISGFVNQFGALAIPEAISPSRNFQFIPYAAYGRARVLEDDPARGASYQTDDEARAGLDAKFVLRDAVTVDVTVNPDFSQVESDEPQVIVNKRFEVFFPEKRPFFIENAGFFSTPINLFFSRRIREPDYGVRVTGKEGRWVFGGLAIDDVSPLEEDFGLVDDERAKIGVARVQREFGERSYVGFLATQRDVGPFADTVASFDSRLQIDDNWAFSAQAAGSRFTLDGEDDLDGEAFYAEIARSGLHLTYTGSFSDISEDFRTDLGFVPRVDIRQTSQSLTYLFRPTEHPTIVSHGPTLSFLGTWDHDSTKQDWDVTGSYTVNLTRATTVTLSATEAYERFLSEEFRKDQYAVSLSSEPFSWLTGSIFYARGDAINFIPAEGLDPFLGDGDTLQVTLTLKPIDRFRIDNTYIYNDLSTRGRVSPSLDGERTIYVNNLLRSKFAYQFTRELSARVILDYFGLSPRESLIQLGEQKRWAGDVLLTYLLNPGTAIYLGYTDNYENVRVLPTTPPSIGFTHSADTSTGRQFFVKVSYLLRF